MFVSLFEKESVRKELHTAYYSYVIPDDDKVSVHCFNWSNHNPRQVLTRFIASKYP